MANSTQSVGGGIGFLGLLALVFIVLKLTGFISWSWWWVLTPLWGPAAFLVLILLVIVAAAIVGSLFSDSKK